MRKIFNISFWIAIIFWFLILNPVERFYAFKTVDKTVELPPWFLYTIAIITSILGIIGKTIDVLKYLDERKKKPKDKNDK